MLYPYQCQECDREFDEEYRMGHAPRQVKCSVCGCVSKRVYHGLGITSSISVITHPSTFGEQMKARNNEAGYRMQGREAPVRVTAYDHGNGDIREVVPTKK